MPSSKHKIPRTPGAAKRLGYTKRSNKKQLFRGVSDSMKRNMVMVGFDAKSGAPTRFCHWDPDTGVWVCSDA